MAILHVYAEDLHVRMAVLHVYAAFLHVHAEPLQKAGVVSSMMIFVMRAWDGAMQTSAPTAKAMTLYRISFPPPRFNPDGRLC